MSKEKVKKPCCLICEHMCSQEYLCNTYSRKTAKQLWCEVKNEPIEAKELESCCDNYKKKTTKELKQVKADNLIQRSCKKCANFMPANVITGDGTLLADGEICIEYFRRTNHFLPPDHTEFYMDCPSFVKKKENKGLFDERDKCYTCKYCTTAKEGNLRFVCTFDGSGLIPGSACAHYEEKGVEEDV